MGKGKRVSGKHTGGIGAVARRVGKTTPDSTLNQGKGKATASWTAMKNIQKQKPGPPLVTQACQASKAPRPCIKKFMAELHSKIMNTPASTYNQPRKTRQLPSASCEVYCFWDGACFLMSLVDCQDGLQGPQFLDSHAFQDLAQPDDELYVLELLHSIEYASAIKSEQGSPEVAPHALELLRGAPVDVPEGNPREAQSHAELLDPFANQSMAAMPDEDFLEMLSVDWKGIQEDPERTVKQERAFKEGLIGVTCYLEVKPRAEKPAQAKVEEDPEERLDDDFLAEVSASAEDGVASAPQSPAAPIIHPFLKEPPAGSSLHKYYLDLSATLPSLEIGTAGSGATQQQESPYINLDVLGLMDFLVKLPEKDQLQASQPPTSAAPTFLESGAAASILTQQEESSCIGLSVQDAADLVAVLVAGFPAKYQPQASEPLISARTMRYSDIGLFMQQPPVSQCAAPSPEFPSGRTQPSAARSHPDETPPSVVPAERPKRRQLATAPSVGPGLLAPLEGSPPLTGPQDCAPATGACTIHQQPKAAAPADVPRRKGQACAKRKAADTGSVSEDVPAPAKEARTSEPQKVAHEQLLRVQRARRSPQAQQQQKAWLHAAE